MGRTYVFGDIHGCLTALDELLAVVSPDPAVDTLVFLGDYIDRGPDSAGVLTRLAGLAGEFSRFVALKGNHEQMLLDFLGGGQEELFLLMGGAQTLQSYGLAPSEYHRAGEVIPENHLGLLRNLLPWWGDKTYLYVHAGIEPGVHLTQQRPAWLFWARENFLATDHDFGRRVIFGHTPFPQPLVEPHRIGIDTGAVYGGRLTCLVLPELRFVSVPVERYWRPGGGI